MATTTHGHYIHGSLGTKDDKQHIRLAKNCGGMDFCSDCRAEGEQWRRDNPDKLLPEYQDVEAAKMRHPSTINQRRTKTVDHPDHYGGKDNPYEVIKVIKAWELGFHLGNAVKYIARAGKKNSETLIEDLEKAIWYLQDYVNWLKGRTQK